MALLRSQIAVAVLLAASCHAFTNPPSSQSSRSRSPSALGMSTTPDKKERYVPKWKKKPTLAEESADALLSTIGEREAKAPTATTKKERYVPKWKKKATLAEQSGGLSTKDKGLAGAIPIRFQQGEGEDATFVETNALPGQPLKLVASQAGQYIKYGCGKGECGTCESLCDGRYVRPCVDAVPTDLAPNPETGEYDPLVIRVKGTRAKVISSGKFYSVRSIFVGFWNNLLGMGGLVRDRRAAKRNWQERMTKEEEIRRLTAEKKRKRAEAEAAAALDK